MSGHSKWANIKHKKAAADARRGKAFSGVIKKISSAARRGGGDPDMNAELRLCLDKARAVNMPADTIRRAILKATGQLEGVSIESFCYEGYGPGGVAIMVEGSTDNKTRTVAEVRTAFKKNGGALGESGCVGWMFQTRGTISIRRELVKDADALMEIALEQGADDLDDAPEGITIVAGPEAYLRIRDALVKRGYSEFETDEISKVATNSVEADAATAAAVIRIVDVLEENDDVENVYTNIAISDETAAAMEGA